MKSLAVLQLTFMYRSAKAKKTVQNTVTPDSNDKGEEINASQEDEIDDFSIEIEEKSTVNEVIEIIEDEEALDPVEVEDYSASGRLASLRDEILTDDKPVDTRPISDRMADFFKD